MEHVTLPKVLTEELIQDPFEEVVVSSEIATETWHS